MQESLHGPAYPLCIQSQTFARERKQGSLPIGFEPAIVTDAAVGRVLTPAEVLGVIAGAFVDPPVTPARSVAECLDASGARALLAMPSLRPGGIATVKVVNARSDGLNSHLLAFDQRGELLAVVEAHRLTALRTAAASVLAARTLGAGGARQLAVLGAGRQARAHIEAYAAAFSIEAVSIWARRDDAACDLAGVAGQHVPAVRIAASPDDAAEGADIVVCATPSTEPLLTSDMVSRAHVDLVGGFRPNMREADDALMARAAIVVDTSAALTEAGDLVHPIASGVIARDRVLLLADILTGIVPVPHCQVIVFKSVGHAAEDLVVMELLLARLGLITRALTEVSLQQAAFHA